jgi:DNA replicative helicase MCM subunit Mcm2 (Cdc46/Mcm family)
MNQKPNQHSVRRIVLPSGRTIEVVRFHEAEPEAPQGLHVCPECKSELVQPIAWSEAAEDRWELTLSCPNCQWSTEGIYDEEQVHALEERLDQGLADMLRDLQRLTQANMADQIERFAQALHADHILPEDF